MSASAIEVAAGLWQLIYKGAQFYPCSWNSTSMSFYVKWCMNVVIPCELWSPVHRWLLTSVWSTFFTQNGLVALGDCSLTSAIKLAEYFPRFICLCNVSFVNGLYWQLRLISPIWFWELTHHQRVTVVINCPSWTRSHIYFYYLTCAYIPGMPGIDFPVVCACTVGGGRWVSAAGVDPVHLSQA